MTGATGFVGGRLARELKGRGVEVRCMVRGRSRATDLADEGFELHEGDVSKPDTLNGAGEGCDVAYYLIHGMGRGSDGDFEQHEREAATAFARMAKDEGVGRVIYLGGLGEQPKSKHLRSRHETARCLAQHGPPLTYFRAAMVVGSQSESYKTLRYLVERLPAMIAPGWLKTPTQPIAADDVIDYLVQAPAIDESAAREIQIGGPDVISYGEMLDHMSDALGKRHRPKLPVPFLTPKLSSHWIGFVTPVDAGVARPLVEGLSTETTVTDPAGMSLFDVEPVGIDQALERALEGERSGAPA
ncbi:MAG: NAD(P)H-binding protein [Thermoleophilaceae bacterium]|nr:NAD(P)H-binding protein [Thermoleophilaceae bacterium]